MIRPQMFSGASVVPGQQQWTTAGTFSFVVPDGVVEIAAVCIAPGGGGACGASGDTNESPAGGGGGLSYSNTIAVTPGETLTIINGSVGAAGGTMSSGGNGGDSGIRRGASTFLLKAQGGRGGNWSSGVGGLGGAAASGIGDVRYSGGNGQSATSFTYPGWSGLYTGNGFSGSSSYSNKSADLYGASSGTSLGCGGRGGRTSASPGNTGGVRIMWGYGRSFPGAAANV